MQWINEYLSLEKVLLHTEEIVTHRKLWMIT